MSVDLEGWCGQPSLVGRGGLMSVDLEGWCCQSLSRW